MADKVADAQMGNINIDRAGRMVLYPLAEVGIGVLVPIVVGCGQLMVDILGNGKRSNGEQQQDKAAARCTAATENTPAGDRAVHGCIARIRLSNLVGKLRNMGVQGLSNTAHEKPWKASATLSSHFSGHFLVIPLYFLRFRCRVAPQLYFKRRFQAKGQDHAATTR